MIVKTEVLRLLNELFALVKLSNIGMILVVVDLVDLLVVARLLDAFALKVALFNLFKVSLVTGAT